jgi:hypothetical protein
LLRVLAGGGTGGQGAGVHALQDEVGQRKRQHGEQGEAGGGDEGGALLHESRDASEAAARWYLRAGREPVPEAPQQYRQQGQG